MLKNLVVVGLVVLAGVVQAQEPTPDGIAGVGKWVYRPDLGQMDPELAQAANLHSHGQFAAVNGQLYTCIPSQGLIRTTPDLAKWEIIAGTDAETLKRVNAHGICAFQGKSETLLAVADNGGHVWILDPTSGKIRADIQRPAGTEFTNAPSHINRHYQMKQAAVPFTGVAYCDGSLWVTTGYAGDEDGDNLLELKIDDGNFKWGTRAYGRRGGELGDFRTAHGISSHEGLLFLASRHNDQLFVFEPKKDKLELRKIFNLKEQQTAMGEAGNILICHAVVHNGVVHCPLLDPHGGREHASSLAYKLTIPKGVVEVLNTDPKTLQANRSVALSLDNGVEFDYVGRLTPGLHDPSLKEKRRFHGQLVFDWKAPDGTLKTMSACHIWKGGPTQQAGLLIFELQPL